MNYLKNFLGFSSDPSRQFLSTLSQNQFPTTLYSIHHHQQLTIFNQCTVNITTDQQNTNYLHFKSPEQKQESQYYFPIDNNFKIYTKKIGIEQIHFLQFQIPKPKKYLGFKLQTKYYQPFVPLLSKIIQVQQKITITDQLSNKIIKKQQSVYLQENKQQLNESKILVDIAQNPKILMVNSCCIYIVCQQKIIMSEKNAIFCVKQMSPYQYTAILGVPKQSTKTQNLYPSIHQNDIHPDLQTIHCFPISYSLNYQINCQKNFFKYFDIYSVDPIIRILYFEGHGVAMALKVLLTKCLWQNRVKKKVDDVISNQQLNYITKINNQPQIINQEKDIVKFYQQTVQKNKQFEIQIEDSKDIATQGLKQFCKMRAICQAKSVDCTLVSNGQKTHIYLQDKNEKFKNVGYLKNMQNIYPRQLLMQQKDTRCIMLDQNELNKIIYYDMDKQTIVKTFQSKKLKDVLEICPEDKSADIKSIPTFYGIGQKVVYRFDPRFQNIIAAQKKYSQSNQQQFFQSISSNNQGHFATGSSTGNIRLYKQVGQNAKNTYRGLGDPIIALDSSRDGHYLLCTCDNYLLLLPTFVDGNIFLLDNDGYTDTIPISERQIPRKLSIKAQDLKKEGIKQIQFLPAKFDQSQDDQQKYIVSGFKNYVVIWDFLRVLKGKIFSYQIMKVDDMMFSAQFKFNNNKKLIMAMQHNVRLQQNRILQQKK